MYQNKALASAITLGPWTLAQSTSAGLGLAPDALPIWAIEPRSDVAFHNAQISTVYGVLLYPILGGVARCGWLGPWAAAPEKLYLTKTLRFNKKISAILPCCWTSHFPFI